MKIDRLTAQNNKITPSSVIERINIFIRNSRAIEDDDDDD